MSRKQPSVVAAYITKQYVGAICVTQTCNMSINGKHCTQAWVGATGSSSIKKHMQKVHHISFANTASSSAASIFDDGDDDIDAIDASQPAAASSSSSSSMVSSAAIDLHIKRTSSDSSASLSSPPAVKRITVDSSITDYYDPVTSAQLMEQITVTFAGCGLPLHLIDNDLFRQLLIMVHSARTLRLPHRRALRSNYTRKHASVRERVEEVLVKSVIVPVSFLLDGWTNINQDKVTNIVVMHNGIAYYWCSITNTYSASNAEYYYNICKHQMLAIIALKIRIVAFVADNEATMNKTHSLLLVDFPFLIRVPCCAHIIQLIVRRMLKLDAFAATITTMMSIVKQFKDHKSLRTNLKERQRIDNQYHKLIKPNDTRWSSTLAAVNRLLKLRKYIELMDDVAQDDSFWSQLKSISQSLTPFQIATDIIQRDCSTLIDVHEQFRYLDNQCARIGDTHGRPTMTMVKELIQQRWLSHVNVDATVASAIFAMRDLSSFTDHEVTSGYVFIVEFGKQYLTYYGHCPDSRTSDAAEGNLELQLTAFRNRTAQFRFSDMERKISLMRTALALHEVWHPKTIWENYSIHCFALSIVAIAILSVSASEAAVERTFSTQGEIHRLKRNRLLNVSIESEMYIRLNEIALKKRYAPSGSFIEMDEDYLEADDDGIDVDMPLRDDDEFIPIYSADDNLDVNHDVNDHREIVDDDVDEMNVDEAPAASSSSSAPASSSSRSLRRSRSRVRAKLSPRHRIKVYNKFAHSFIELNRCMHVEKWIWSSDALNNLNSAMVMNDPQIDANEQDMVNIITNIINL
jgi:hypothetical protein